MLLLYPNEAPLSVRWPRYPSPDGHDGRFSVGAPEVSNHKCTVFRIVNALKCVRKTLSIHLASRNESRLAKQ